MKIKSQKTENRAFTEYEYLEKPIASHLILQICDLNILEIAHIFWIHMFSVYCVVDTIFSISSESTVV